MTKYNNPRIDTPNPVGEAHIGSVSVDPKKTFWVASMMTGGLIGAAFTVSLSAVVLFALTTLFTICLGHSLGMHRLYIHRSYKAPKWLEYFLVHLGVLIGLAGPFGMAYTHDLRDWAQRQPQCHPFFSHASVWYRDFFWQIFCSIELRQSPTFKLEENVAKNPVYRFMEATWMWQQLPWAILFLSIGGWGWVFWGICSRVTISIVGHWLIGYFAHNRGPRDWHVNGAAVQGYNVPWAALLTQGESWHNNHHAFPGSAKLGLEPGQWDPGWWVLKLLERLNLVSDFRLPEQLAYRRELVRLKTLAE